MEKEQYRSVIRFSFLDGKTWDEIEAKLDAVYGDLSPSMPTVRYKFNEVKRDRTSFYDEERPGRPAVTAKIVKKVQVMILADHGTKVRDVAEAVGVATFNILHDKWGMRKLLPDGCRKCSRWTIRGYVCQHRSRVWTSLCEIRRVLRLVLAADKTWIHYYTPKTKQKSKQWIFRVEFASKKTKTVPLAGKVMTTIIGDSKGIILIDFLKKGRTNTGQYYNEFLD